MRNISRAPPGETGTPPLKNNHSREFARQGRRGYASLRHPDALANAHPNERLTGDTTCGDSMKPLPADDLQHVLQHAPALAELRGARLFITGGTGFFGKWLLETFAYANRELALNAKTVVLSRNPGKFLAQMPHLAAEDCIEFVQGDVTSFAFPPGDFSHIIHAATETTTRLGRPQPLDTLDTIVSGTRRVLDLARDRHVQAMLLTSSGAVYGRQPPEMTHIPEDYPGAPDPLDPNAAYGNGKRFAEHLCAAYHAQYNVPSKIARCFAFVGPHLPLEAHFAIGNFIRDALAGGPIVVQGDGTPYRSYLYAADLAVWLWEIMVHGQIMRPYNVGSSEAISIRDLAHLISASRGQTVRVAQEPNPSTPAVRYVPSTTRIHQEMVMGCQIDASEAIARTIQWQISQGPTHGQ